MHLVLEPLSFVVLPIWPVIFALPAYFILGEFSIVVATLRENELATPMLASLIVETFILSAVRPLLLAVTVLLILFPVASVHRSIGMYVCTFAVRLVIRPLSLVDVAVSMIQLPVAARSV